MTQLIKGYFKSGFPIISLAINNKYIDFLLDTGFNGYIMLPEAIIQNLGLIHTGFSEYKTANGQTNAAKIYDAAIILFNKEKNIFVLSTDSNFSLAGIGLFYDCKIIIERYNDIVTIYENKE